MKNKIKYLIILLGTLFLFSPSVLAKPTIVSVVEQYESAGTRDLYLVTANANGETITGVTTMKMDVGMDTGDIYLTKEVEIEKDDTYGTLYEILL